VHEGGRLLAAAGTHVVARRAETPAVTAAVATDLLALPMRDIALNVAVENATAIGVYQRLGFKEHSRYWAVRGRLRR
jgi:ribosomal protein S18 acetylase RimI-like enzyme